MTSKQIKLDLISNRQGTKWTTAKLSSEYGCSRNTARKLLFSMTPAHQGDPFDAYCIGQDSRGGDWYMICKERPSEGNLFSSLDKDGNVIENDTVRVCGYKVGKKDFTRRVV